MCSSDLAATLHLAATFTGSAPVELPSFTHEVSLLEQPDRKSVV